MPPDGVRSSSVQRNGLSGHPVHEPVFGGHEPLESHNTTQALPCSPTNAVCTQRIPAGQNASFGQSALHDEKSRANASAYFMP